MSGMQHYDGDIRDLELTFSFDEDVLGKVRTKPFNPNMATSRLKS